MLIILNVCILLIGLIGQYAGFIFALIFTLYIWYNSEKRFLKKYKINTIPEDEFINQKEANLHNIVNILSAKAKIKKPKIAIDFKDPFPNAFTVGRNRGNSTIILTIGLLDRIGYEFTPLELEAIIAHEIGHIINRDVAIMTWAAMYSYLTFFLTYPLNQIREFKADESAVKILGDSSHLISALDKMSRYNKDYRMRDKIFGTHPRTGDRITNLKDM